MTTTHTMTIDVTAWRIAEDGSLPEVAREAMDGRVLNLRRISGRYDDHEWRTKTTVHDIIRKTIPDWPQPQRNYDYWAWYSEGVGGQRANAGDWIVCHEYGIEAMSDSAFRECCEEVGDDA